jgi:hypothetical protein
VKSAIYNPIKLQVKFLTTAITLIISLGFLTTESFAITETVPLKSKESGIHASYLKQVKVSDTYLLSLKNNKISQMRDNDLRYRNYPFILFMGVTLILMFIKTSAPDYYRELLSNFSKPNYILDSYPVRRVLFRISNVFTDISELAIISLLIFKIYNDYSDTYVAFYKIVIITGGFFLIRIIIIYPFYYIFFGRNKINVHSSNIFIFNRIMFIFLLPIIFISIYSFRPYQNIFQWISLIIILSFFLYRTLRIFFQIKNTNNYNIFYIFLYICIFEISPFFVLIKEFSNII